MLRLKPGACLRRTPVDERALRCNNGLLDILAQGELRLSVNMVRV